MKKMILLVALFLTTNLYAHDIGKQCYNPLCMMCNNNHLLYGHNLPPALSYNEYLLIHNAAHINSTPQVVVDEMLKLLNLTEDDLFIDLGCGDGRFVKTAAQKYGCKSLGIEIDPQIATVAKQNIKGIKRTRIQVADIRKLNFNNFGTAFSMYLSTDLMEEILPKLTNATRIISYSHPIPGAKEIMVKGKYPVYLWEKNANIPSFQ